MTWKRSIPFIVVLGIAALGLLSVPSLGTGGECKPRDDVRIAMNASVRIDDERLVIEVAGPPGAAGALHGFISVPSLSTVPGTFAWNFQFDANGTFTVDASLRDLQGIPAFDCVFAASLLDGSSYGPTTQTWGLHLERWASDDPNAPLAPAGGTALFPIAGTTAPLFPVSWASIVAPALAGSGTEHLLFICSVPGVEGVLPVH